MSNMNEQAKETRFSYCPLCKLKSIYFKAFVGGEDMYICRFCNFAVIANPYSSATKEIKSLEMLEQANDSANQHCKGYQESDYWRENCLTCAHLRCDHDDGEQQYCNLAPCDCPKFVEGEISGKHTPGDEPVCSFCGKGRWDGIHHDGCDECHPFSAPSDEAEE